MYSSINDFLDKFKKLLGQSEAVYKIIAEIIAKHITVEITVNKIKVKGSTIFIDGSPTLKNEILIHQQGILADLKDLLPDRKFTEIR